MMRRDYFAIGLIVFVLGLLLITAEHWSEVTIMFQSITNGLFGVLTPILITIAGIIWLVASIF